MEVFRIENPNTHAGMWYNRHGEFDPVIQELCPHSRMKELPMPYDERHYKDGFKWFSAADSIENLMEWFSEDDIDRLICNGYKLYRMEISMFQILEHEVLFCREGITCREEIQLKHSL